ncbi:MAG: glycoside hydrolase family 15 protein, partial [Actinomycetota bacterium]|nr:glycoside hydrolase family 15 protein [Actinomycetota bacterium]
DEDNGRWLLAPAGEVRRVERRYREHTLVHELDFHTDEGSVRVIDFMPPRGVDPDVVRIVEGLAGEVRMRMQLVIRFDYGWIVPWVRRIAEGARIAIAGPDALALQAPVELYGENFTTVAEFAVAAGERVPFTLTWFPSHHEAPAPIDPEQALEDTCDFWREWAGTCTYNGHWREPVIRSLMVLKAMTYAPTGGIVAAPTTSLPEKLGGVRNWDYRYCWLRDATFALDALVDHGFIDEARGWRSWLLRAVAGNPDDLQIMYGPAGERRLLELELDWLPGYEESRPVRIGNGASKQFQLDVYGEVLDVLHQARMRKLEQDEDSWALQRRLLESLEERWREPDEGIWEVRGPRRHFTHSKVMAWVGFDRGIKAVEDFGHEGPVNRWRELRAEIHAEVLSRGFDRELNSFVQSYESERLDASLLTIPIVGFLPPDDPRVRGTLEAIRRELYQDGFVQRYSHDEAAEIVDGLPPGEGAFLLCTFWFIDNLALLGELDEAYELFGRMVALRNDLGLLSEEYDVGLGRFCGNFPQAFSHIGLINTATILEAAFASRARALPA